MIRHWSWILLEEEEDLHFWQNGQALLVLHGTVAIQGCNRNQNRSQHERLTLETENTIQGWNRNQNRSQHERLTLETENTIQGWNRNQNRSQHGRLTLETENTIQGWNRNQNRSQHERLTLETENTIQGWNRNQNGRLTGKWKLSHCYCQGSNPQPFNKESSTLPLSWPHFCFSMFLLYMYFSFATFSVCFVDMFCPVHKKRMGKKSITVKLRILFQSKTAYNYNNWDNQGNYYCCIFSVLYARVLAYYIHRLPKQQSEDNNEHSPVFFIPVLDARLDWLLVESLCDYQGKGSSHSVDLPEPFQC